MGIKWTEEEVNLLLKLVKEDGLTIKAASLKLKDYGFTRTHAACKIKIQWINNESLNKNLIQEYKICSKCNEEKSEKEFYKRKISSGVSLEPYCKSCYKIINNNRRFKDHEKTKREDRIRYKRNQNKNIKRRRDYYKKNKKEIRERARKERRENPEKYNNPESRKKRSAYAREYLKKRRKEDPLFKLKASCRNWVYSCIKHANIKKRDNSLNYVGCSPEELRNYIESLWWDGMSWNNHGRGKSCWHVDHIIPLHAAKTEEDVYRLCHYTNLQPLWEKDNLRKNGSLDWNG